MGPELVQGSNLSVSFIFLAIMVRNSGKSIVPFPSASTCTTCQEKIIDSNICESTSKNTETMFTSLIMSWSSASVGFWPRDLIT